MVSLSLDCLEQILPVAMPCLCRLPPPTLPCRGRLKSRYPGIPKGTFDHTMFLIVHEVVHPKTKYLKPLVASVSAPHICKSRVAAERPPVFLESPHSPRPRTSRVCWSCAFIRSSLRIVSWQMWPGFTTISDIMFSTIRYKRLAFLPLLRRSVLPC